MNNLLKQSTAKVISFGPFVDPTDGKTLVIGLVSALDNGTTGIKLSKAGGAFAVRHAAATATTYDAYGNYLVTLDATDTNTLGALRVQFTDSTKNLPVWRDFEVVPANVFDSMVAGSDSLEVDTVAIDGDTDAARKQKKAAEAIYEGTVTGASTTTTIADSGITEVATHWVGRVVIFDAPATLARQATIIKTSTVGGLEFDVLNALTSAPQVGDKYGIY